MTTMTKVEERTYSPELGDVLLVPIILSPWPTFDTRTPDELPPVNDGLPVECHHGAFVRYEPDGTAVITEWDCVLCHEMQGPPDPILRAAPAQNEPTRPKGA